MRFFILFSMFCLGPLFSENKSEGKIYLDAKEIAIQENQILILIDNQWQTAEALFADANGIYVLGRKWYEPWECGFCGVTNPPHRLSCWNCGR